MTLKWKMVIILQMVNMKTDGQFEIKIGHLLLFLFLIDSLGNSHKNGTADTSANHSSLDTDEDMGMLNYFGLFTLVFDKVQIFIFEFLFVTTNRCGSDTK